MMQEKHVQKWDNSKRKKVLTYTYMQGFRSVIYVTFPYTDKQEIRLVPVLRLYPGVCFSCIVTNLHLSVI